MNTMPSQSGQNHKPSTAIRTVQQFDLSKITGYGWNAVYEALNLAIDGIGGITNQPRCIADNGYLNEAGEYLENVLEFLTLERRRAMETLIEKDHSSENDIDQIGRLKLTWMLYDDAPLADISQMALAVLAEERSGKGKPVDNGGKSP